ncbi:uncharacterized protein UHOD_11827 [Ustilago sp. UG-2017b]|nr:uncharacterized protein UHOD_11827 [Ustilago sp. UG-2017b]
MLLQIPTNRCGHSVQRWLGTININTKVMVKLVVSIKTPRSSTAVDYCLRFYLYPDRWSAMNRLRMSWMRIHSTFDDEKRVPSSSSTARGPSSATPVLLSRVDSFDTAPPPQDLLAGLLYTAPPPSTSDGSFDSYLSSP